jgi:hypothetical protein
MTPAFYPLLVVLMNFAVARIAEARQCSLAGPMGELMAVLDQLERHFASEISQAGARKRLT